MTSRDLEREINELINSKDEILLQCKVNLELIGYSDCTQIITSASISDFKDNTFAYFRSVINRNKYAIIDEKVKDTLYESLRKSILSWAMFGVTNTNWLSLHDALKCARVIDNNK